MKLALAYLAAVFALATGLRAADAGPSGWRLVWADEFDGPGPLPDAFHVFAVEWDPGRIRWFVDGTAYHEMTPERLPAGKSWVFDAPQFVLLNLAVGGHWPGRPDASTEFPQRLVVDHVRVYAREPKP